LRIEVKRIIVDRFLVIWRVACAACHVQRFVLFLYLQFFFFCFIYLFYFFFFALFYFFFLTLLMWE
jgi:hypothetical protein